jgi:hypothetical protein
MPETHVTSALVPMSCRAWGFSGTKAHRAVVRMRSHGVKESATAEEEEDRPNRAGRRWRRRTR